MASVFDPFIKMFQENPILLILALAGIAIYVWYQYFYKEEKQPEFKEITFSMVTTKDLDERFKFHKINVKAGLRQGFDFLGDVESYVKAKGNFKWMKYVEDKDKYIQDKEMGYELYIFRIWNVNFLYKLLNWGTKKYVLVDKKHLSNIAIDESTKSWNIKPNVQFVRLGGHFVTSDAGAEYLTDIHIKFRYETLLTHTQNYTRKANFLEVEHSKLINAYMLKKKVDSKLWNEYQTAAGSDKLAEKES